MIIWGYTGVIIHWFYGVFFRFCNGYLGYVGVGGVRGQIGSISSSRCLRPDSCVPQIWVSLPWLTVKVIPGRFNLP